MHLGVGVVGETLSPVHVKIVATKYTLGRGEILQLSCSEHVASLLSFKNAGYFMQLENTTPFNILSVKNILCTKPNQDRHDTIASIILSVNKRVLLNKD